MKYLGKASSIDKTQLGAGVHHLHLWLTAAWTDKDEAEGIGQPPIVVLQAIAVGHIARLVCRQFLPQALQVNVLWAQQERSITV